MSEATTRQGRARLLLSVAAAAGALSLGIASRADAVITTYTDRATWQAAASLLGTVQTEGFEGQPTGTLPVGDNQLGLMTLKIGLVTATTSGASISSSTPIAGTRDLSINADQGMRTYDVSFGAPILAMGFDFEGAATGGIATLEVGGQSYAFGSAGNGFFGIISTELLAGAAFGDTNPGALPTEIFNSDDFSFVAVPEPASAMLLAPATLLMLRRRRQGR